MDFQNVIVENFSLLNLMSTRDAFDKSILTRIVSNGLNLNYWWNELNAGHFC